MTCQSIKSKKIHYEKCSGLCLPDSIFCKKHQDFNHIYLDPLQSSNDADIVTLETITCVKDGARVLADEIDPKHLFTYKIVIDGQEYQRTLNILTMRNLIDKKIYTEPFSNVPFPPEVLERATEILSYLKLVKQKTTLRDKKDALLNTLISKFGEIGYIVHYEWLSKLKPFQYESWHREFRDYFWKEFKQSNPEVALLIYPPLDLPMFQYNRHFQIRCLELYVEICSNHIQGTQLIIQALAQTNHIIKDALGI